MRLARKTKKTVGYVMLPKVNGRFAEPTWPKNVTIRIRDVKDRIYCTNCGKLWEGGLLESFEFDKAKFTEDAVTVPMNMGPCTCQNPPEGSQHFYVGTEQYITGNVSLPQVREDLKKAGVKLVP